MLKHSLIMAAGRGMRLMPLTLEVPKAMVEIDGITLIARAIRQLKAQVPFIAVTVGYKGALLAKYVIEEGVSAIFNTEGRGNCWWIYNTPLQYLDEPVLVLTCDNIVDLDLDFLIWNYNKLHCPPCMVVPVSPVEGIDGDFVFGRNGVVTKLSRWERSTTYCSGIQILNPAVIFRTTGRMEDFNELWRDLIAKECLCYSETYPYPWISVNAQENIVQYRLGNKCML